MFWILISVFILGIFVLFMLAVKRSEIKETSNLSKTVQKASKAQRVNEVKCTCNFGRELRIK